MGETAGRWVRAPPAMAPVNVVEGGRLGLAAGALGGAAGQDRWRHSDSSVNAVSFGFVATAILIAMFLVMAIFERFLQPRSGPPLFSLPPEQTWRRRLWRFGRRGSPAPGPDDLQGAGPGGHHHPHPPQPFDGKLLDDSYPTPKMPAYAKEVSVLMPGQEIPTFLAHPAPVPCPPERVAWPSHQQISLSSTTSDPS